jgi:ABC-type Fe3+-hydroxamate transport system substrate-binding protein
MKRLSVLLLASLPFLPVGCAGQQDGAVDPAFAKDRAIYCYRFVDPTDKPVVFVIAGERKVSMAPNSTQDVKLAGPILSKNDPAQQGFMGPYPITLTDADGKPITLFRVKSGTEENSFVYTYEDVGPALTVPPGDAAK